MTTLNKKKEFQSNNHLGMPCFHHVEVFEPSYHVANKHEGNIKFLYGIKPSPSLNDADYFGNKYDGKYLNNHCSSQGFPTTIIPIKGSVYFKKNEDYKIIDIRILPYVDTKHLRPCLIYGEDDNKVIEMASNEPSEIEFSRRLQEAGSFKIYIDPENDDKTKLYFDLHLRKEGGYTDFGKNDWESPITDQSFFAQRTEQECFLALEIPIRIYYKSKKAPSIKNQSDLFITIRSIKDLPPDYRYFEGNPYSSVVYIPPLTICWANPHQSNTTTK